MKKTSWLARLFGWNEQRAITQETANIEGILGEPQTRIKVEVTELTALGVSAIWCAVNVISQSIGSLPLVLYRKKPDGGREPAYDHNLYPVFHDSPNEEMVRSTFFEVLMSHCLLYGTAYAEIERNNAGEPIAFWPIAPQFVQTYRHTDTGKLMYRVMIPQGILQKPNQSGPIELEQEDMIAVVGLSPDGSAGYSLLQIARDNIGYTIACDAFGQYYFGNAARLGGLLTTDHTMSDEGRNNLLKSWAQQYGSVHNMSKTALLEEGVKYQPFTFTNEAGLYQETRRFQIGEVSRLFNITPTTLHELGRATWGNLGTLNTDFVTTTLRPWMEQFESEFERKCGFLGSDMYLEFNADALLRGDTLSRYQAYAIATNNAPFLLSDEVRALENLPALTEEQKAELRPLPPALQAPADQQEPTDEANPNADDSAEE